MKHCAIRINKGSIGNCTRELDGGARGRGNGAELNTAYGLCTFHVITPTIARQGSRYQANYRSRTLDYQIAAAAVTAVTAATAKTRKTTTRRMMTIIIIIIMIKIMIRIIHIIICLVYANAPLEKILCSTIYTHSHSLVYDRPLQFD
jgi:hypothetical protein